MAGAAQFPKNKIRCLPRIARNTDDRDALLRKKIINSFLQGLHGSPLLARVSGAAMRNPK
jgi:hypothetical protein